MKFQGVIPALITTIDEKGNLNLKALHHLMGDLLAQGADGFYLCGATGEGLNLSVDLHRDITREAIKFVNGRVPCIVHVARMNFAEMISLAQYAESVGAAAVSAIPPMFYKYSEDEIYDYYKALAESVHIPVVIYNNPNTGVTFSSSLLTRLFTIPNLTSIKWTNYDFYSVMKMKYDVPNANVINGPDEMLLMGLSAGCDACIGTTYNYILPTVKGVYNDFRAGNIEAAREKQTMICNVVKSLFGRSTIMVSKFILYKQGYDVYYPIPPMRKLTPEIEQQVVEELERIGMKF